MAIAIPGAPFHIIPERKKIQIIIQGRGVCVPPYFSSCKKSVDFSHPAPTNLLERRYNKIPLNHIICFVRDQPTVCTHFLSSHVALFSLANPAKQSQRNVRAVCVPPPSFCPCAHSIECRPSLQVRDLSCSFPCCFLFR